MTGTQEAHKARSRRAIERDIELQMRRMNALIDELDKRDSRPAEPEGNADIRFSVQFDPRRTVYTYAAAKINGGWYLTGRSSGRKTWDEIVDLMQEDYSVRTKAKPLQFVVMHVANGQLVTAGEW